MAQYLQKGLSRRAGRKVGYKKYMSIGVPLVMVMCHCRMAIGGRSDTEGNPYNPCLKITGGSVFRFRWPVKSGSRTISISVKQTGEEVTSPVFNDAMKELLQAARPSMKIYKDESIGVNTDVESAAPTGTGWVTIGPLAIYPVLDGVLWVELKSNCIRPSAPTYWDLLTTT